MGRDHAAWGGKYGFGACFGCQRARQASLFVPSLPRFSGVAAPCRSIEHCDGNDDIMQPTMLVKCSTTTMETNAAKAGGGRVRLLRTCKLALHLAYVFLFQLLHSTLAPPQLPPGKVYGKFPLLRFSKYARYVLLLPGDKYT